MKNTKNPRAVVLLSGGLDSATTLAIAIKNQYECYALSFDYGQKHRAELTAATTIATTLGAATHKIINLNLAQLGGSALTDDKLEVPDYQPHNTIPITYVPARNTVFLSIALGWAEILEARNIFIGVSCVDYSGYPDCRPEYIAAFENLANLATKAGVEGKLFKIHTPIISLSKAATIRLGTELGVDFRMTVSCYRADNNGRACGNCDSCVLRKEGFNAAGIADPTNYQQPLA